MEEGFVLPLSATSHPRKKTVNMRNQNAREQLGVWCRTINLGDTPLAVSQLLPELRKNRIGLDSNIIKEIAMGRNDSMKITRGDLVDGWMEHLTRESDKLDDMEADVIRLNRVIEHAETNLKKAEAAESGPEDHFGPGSRLLVQLLTLTDFVGNADVTYRVNMECADQVASSKPRHCEDTSVLWNEMFAFQIPSRDQEFEATVHKISDDGREVECGRIRLLLEDLFDQQKHTLRVPLDDAASSGVLSLAAQWLYSKKKLFSKHRDEHVYLREQRLKEVTFQRTLVGQLTAPFSFSQGAGVKGLVKELWSGHLAAKTIDTAMDHLKLTNYQKASHVFVIISLALLSIASYARSLFLELVVLLFAFWCNSDPRRWNVTRYTQMLALLAVATVIDVVWLSVFLQAWADTHSEADLQNVTKIFSLFNFFWRLILMLFFWKCRRDLKSKQQLP
ncbi:MAG: hypothetical protein KVP17_001637 [Porospora cf. gigantea B]|uniref:uncharacterized protein n=1 Tax=Porospora cf. gigantea B TaxID=2853592 RepID=UPI003571D528|nr:MAG: hypothetical protein KVP17_001637 [Porospora cf. gigantea B]